MMIYTILTCGAAAHDKQTTKKRRTFFSLSLSLSLYPWNGKYYYLDDPSGCPLFFFFVQRLPRWFVGHVINGNWLSRLHRGSSSVRFPSSSSSMTPWWLHLLKGTLMAAAPIFLRPSSSPPSVPITGEKKKQTRKTKWEKDILQKKRNKKPKRGGGGRVLHYTSLMMKTNQDAHRWVSIYIYSL